MERQTAIDNIEKTFPPDSEYPLSAAKGRDMLIEAIAANWRCLPDPILSTYAELCINEDLQQTKVIKINAKIE